MQGKMSHPGGSCCRASPDGVSLRNLNVTEHAGAEASDVSQEPKWEQLLGSAIELLMKWKIS